MSFDNEQDNRPQETQTKDADAELQKCQQALVQSSEKYVYLVAEFDNFKRRTEREKSQWSLQAQISIITDLLPIVDDLERALTELKQKQIPEEFQAYFSGFELIHRAIQKFLKTHHIEEITDITTFDPQKHEAIM